MLALGHSPSRALERLAASPKYRERLPSLRTAQRMAREVRPAQPGERWSFTHAEPDEARLVLPVLAAVGEGYGSLSRETAEWVVRVRRAAPEMEPYAAFVWAIRYQAAVTAGKPTGWLDLGLAKETA